MTWREFTRLDIDPPGEACVFLGSQTDFSATHRAIEFCRLHGLFCVFLFDHWCNYAEHFLNTRTNEIFLPNLICVPDEPAERGLREKLSLGLEQANKPPVIQAVGHPAIEAGVKRIQEIDPKQSQRTRESLGAKDKKLYLFLLEPICGDFSLKREDREFLGYTEYTILEYFLEHFCEDDAKLLLKPHPRQDVEDLKRFVDKRFGAREIDYQWTGEEPLESLIAVADEVFGITTVALIMAIKAGKPVWSLQVGRNERAKKFSNVHLESHLRL